MPKEKFFWCGSAPLSRSKFHHFDSDSRATGDEEISCAHIYLEGNLRGKGFGRPSYAKFRVLKWGGCIGSIDIYPHWQDTICLLFLLTRPRPGTVVNSGNA